MAPDSELYGWRDRSDVKKMLPANAGPLRWCSGNEKGMQNKYIFFFFPEDFCSAFLTTPRKYLSRLFGDYASYETSET